MNEQNNNNNQQIIKILWQILIFKKKYKNDFTYLILLQLFFHDPNYILLHQYYSLENV